MQEKAMRSEMNLKKTTLNVEKPQGELYGMVYLFDLQYGKMKELKYGKTCRQMQAQNQLRIENKKTNPRKG